jgi:hypothetical protein
MPDYCIAGQEFSFSCPVPELESYQIAGTDAKPVAFPVASATARICQTSGWVGGEARRVEAWALSSGTILKVEGGSDVYISPGGRDVVRADESGRVSALDREILVGPALVLALAQRGTWCLHASAVSLVGCVTAFLGESGQGKSTLAEYLDQAGGPDEIRIADDILPITLGASEVDVWPHFPQLKLSKESQPGPGLPEHLPLDRICVLTSAEPDQHPNLRLLSPGQALQAIVSHTAGTRMFDAALLSNHLAFCAGVAGQIPFYQLVYPHRTDALPEIKKMLEASC